MTSEHSDLTIPPPYLLRQTRHGPMLVNPNDAYVGQSLLAYGEYSAAEFELLRQLATTPGMIVEVGANMGALTVPLAKLAAQQSQMLLAVEPQLFVFQQLCANLALNGLTNVLTQYAACGEQESTVQIPILNIHTRQNFGGVPVSQATNGAGLTVPCHTLDTMVGERLVGLLKIDVEGFELAVLKGAQQTLSRSRPLLYVENDRPDLSRDLIEYLWSHNYALHWHLPPLFSADNFYRNPQNLYPGTVSCNMIGTPAEQAWTLEGFQRVEDAGSHPFRRTPASV